MTRDEMTTILTGMCECGCGEVTNVFRGEHRRFVFGHQCRKSPVPYLVDDNGCWIWQGALAQNGYGSLRHNGVTAAAHRVYYEMHRGEIPRGMSLDHLCKTLACVNPDHLEAVTQAENVRRGKGTRLTLQIAREIRAAPGCHRAVAERYGISYAHVASIRQGTAWKEAA